MTLRAYFRVSQAKRGLEKNNLQKYSVMIVPGQAQNTGACEVECPKGISLEYIARMNREYVKATLIKEK